MSSCEHRPLKRCFHQRGTRPYPCDTDAVELPFTSPGPHLSGTRHAAMFPVPRSARARLRHARLDSVVAGVVWGLPNTDLYSTNLPSGFCRSTCPKINDRTEGSHKAFFFARFRRTSGEALNVTPQFRCFAKGRNCLRPSVYTRL